MKLKTLPIFLAFLCMGFGDAVNSFVGLAKDKFALGHFEAQLVAFAGFIMFGLLSVPMGIVQDKIGKKLTLIIGMSIALVGIATVMVLGVNSYAVFLTMVVLLGAGSTILQVSGNPIMRDVSDDGHYSSNLSLGQFIKAIGSFTAPLVFFVAAFYGFTKDQSWSVLFPIFAIAILITILSVATLKITEKKDKDSKPASIGSCLALLGNPYVFAMVMGIFVYVGAEICMAGGMPIYFTTKYNVDPALATQYVMYFFIAIMVARFLGAMILKVLSPKKFLIITSLISLIGLASLALDSKTAALVSLIIIALGFANIFPLIFSMAIDRMPSKSNELSGLMITAIIGGAIIPPIMGKVSDMANPLVGFVVPFVCLCYILVLSVMTKASNK